ncbi:phage exonuclease [Xanthomonas euvesicatoria]|uniref:DNA polymerase-1 n=1 Tax=Xanthomonas euvesicatoria TaxID=456327 RepID=A0AAW3U0C0_XANEU|nr:phage exonuclease [Xanthomonas euvesicatoria]MBB4722638.1 DNA polymerase-1 [Xanthomonas euvesicatoria]MBB4869231.1 DNA polymerase-1 [Xanthomonas euvesicatoria]
MKKRQRPVLLIDADVLRYYMAFKNTKCIDWDGDGDTMEVYQPEKAKVEVAEYIAELVEKFDAADFVLPLSCPEHNFRKDLEPTYKQARHEKPKPALWYALDEFIHAEYADKIIKRHSLEGDDILGTLATHPEPRRCPGPRIVVSIDKDLQTIPCRLYNPNKSDLGVRTIDRYDADLFWMKQALMGDTTDNYTGCPGIGAKRADDALMPVHEAYRDSSPEGHLAALWKAVVDVYEKKGLTANDALIQARLARILRHGDLNYKTNKVNLWKP